MGCPLCECVREGGKAFDLDTSKFSLMDAKSFLDLHFTGIQNTSHTHVLPLCMLGIK